MRLIDVKKIDELTNIATEIEVVTYLQLLVDEAIIAKRFPEFKSIAEEANDYLLKRSSNNAKKLHKLIYEDDFTVSTLEVENID